MGNGSRSLSDISLEGNICLTMINGRCAQIPVVRDDLANKSYRLVPLREDATGATLPESGL